MFFKWIFKFKMYLIYKLLGEDYDTFTYFKLEKTCFYDLPRVLLDDSEVINGGRTLVVQRSDKFNFCMDKDFLEAALKKFER